MLYCTDYPTELYRHTSVPIIGSSMIDNLNVSIGLATYYIILIGTYPVDKFFNKGINFNM